MEEWRFYGKNKKSGRFCLALVIFCLTGQVAWVAENMYCNVLIYKMFHAVTYLVGICHSSLGAARSVTASENAQ